MPARQLRERVERIAAVARQQHERVEDQVCDLADLLVGARLGQQHLGRLLADLARGVLARAVQQPCDVRRARIGVAARLDGARERSREAASLAPARLGAGMTGRAFWHDLQQ